MKSIIYVGMDVHKASFTLSCFSVATQETFATVKTEPTAKAIKQYLDGVRLAHSEECELEESTSGWSMSTRRMQTSPRQRSQENSHASSGA